ncbi:hypothetical protein ACH5RR_026300 [Cinchona calisaya]|uniref:Uncharacterized protein n=1 Tax=Cinchona calisaya TaxID=153742 RepID=A0ABD2Z256_9GENT
MFIARSYGNRLSSWESICFNAANLKPRTANQREGGAPEAAKNYHNRLTRKKEYLVNQPPPVSEEPPPATEEPIQTPPACGTSQQLLEKERIAWAGNNSLMDSVSDDATTENILRTSNEEDHKSLLDTDQVRVPLGDFRTQLREWKKARQIWKIMIRFKEVAEDHIVTIPRKGNSSLWFDNWSQDGALVKEPQDVIHLTDLTLEEAWNGQDWNAKVILAASPNFSLQS